MLTPLLEDDPRQIGPYRLQNRIGAGGMGTVYLGFTPDQQPVAVKVAAADLAEDGEFRRRFEREVNAALRVRGTAVAAILDADVDATAPWMVTEYVEGISLAEAVRTRGRLEDHLVRGLAVGLSDALVAIHAAGVVHRDLKPSNILLAWDGPKVIDFGIAQLTDSATLTRTGHVIGTLAWMSPEQMRGEPSGASADVFAWASCVTYAATGRHPFHAETPDLLAIRVQRDTPDLQALPGYLLNVIAVALSKRAGERPTAAALLTALVGREVRGVTDADAVAGRVLERTWTGSSPAFGVPAGPPVPPVRGAPGPPGPGAGAPAGWAPVVAGPGPAAGPWPMAPPPPASAFRPATPPSSAPPAGSRPRPPAPAHPPVLPVPPVPPLDPEWYRAVESPAPLPESWRSVGNPTEVTFRPGDPTPPSKPPDPAAFTSAGPSPVPAASWPQAVPGGRAYPGPVPPVPDPYGLPGAAVPAGPDASAVPAGPESGVAGGPGGPGPDELAPPGAVGPWWASRESPPGGPGPGVPGPGVPGPPTPTAGAGGPSVATRGPSAWPRTADPGPPSGDRGWNRCAILSVVLGVLWIFGLGSLAAVLLGYLGRSQLRRRGGSGSALATAGIVLGWLGIVTTAWLAIVIRVLV